ncbi:hypothetical protein N5V81_13025 [Escherichia coli]|nr:hypothetical protein [Escherichia coli]
MRTTIRDMCDSNPRLRRALEITNALAYIRNNYHRLESSTISHRRAFAKSYRPEKWDWNEILDNTVEYWMFRGSGSQKVVSVA